MRSRNVVLLLLLAGLAMLSQTPTVAQEEDDTQSVEAAPVTGSGPSDSFERPVDSDEWAIIGLPSIPATPDEIAKGAPPTRPTSDVDVTILKSTSRDITRTVTRPNSEGVADFGRLKMPTDKPEPDEKVHRVSVRFEAAGYAPFTYVNIPVVPGVGHILTPLLSDVEQVDDISAPIPPRGSTSEPLVSIKPVSSSDLSASALLVTPCTAARADVLPQTIRVYQNEGYGHYTPDYNIHTYDFKFYVKHVLSREMGAVRPDNGVAWKTEALRANALAVKMYGWHRTYYGYGGSTGQGCYDVDTTTTYQVFDPYYETTVTNAAVDYTWPWLMTTSSTPFETLYVAGAGSDGCGVVTGATYPNTMGQYGSDACATAGQNWLQILLSYYNNPSFTLRTPPSLPSSTTLVAYVSTTARVSWSATGGVTYKVCTDITWTSALTACGGAVTSPASISVPSSHLGERYIRLMACGSDGYCQAMRIGGIRRSNTTNFKFYHAAQINGSSSARSSVRNTQTIPSSHEFYEGVPGYGGVLKNNSSCVAIPSNSNCTVTFTASNTTINPYLTASQWFYGSSERQYLAVRTRPTTLGE